MELEGNPRPRVSLKVAYFLTDTTAMDRGNFTVVPGSHLRNELEMPADETADPSGATPICVRPGSAVFFDRRLWHSAGINFSEVTRKVLFYGYSYRWLKPRDDMSVAHYMDRCDPIRRQLLGASSGGMGFTSPAEEDVPLLLFFGYIDPDEGSYVLPYLQFDPSLVESGDILPIDNKVAGGALLYTDNSMYGELTTAGYLHNGTLEFDSFDDSPGKTVSGYFQTEIYVWEE